MNRLIVAFGMFCTIDNWGNVGPCFQTYQFCMDWAKNGPWVGCIVNQERGK